MNKRWAIGVAALFFSTPVFAQDKPKSEDGWEIGARAQGFTANPFMSYFYDQHESVQGLTAGGFLTRHSAGGNRVIIGVAYSQVSPKDGVWRQAGDDISSNEVTKFRSFKVLDAHVIIGKEWGFGPFGLFTGAGLGVAVPSGSITSFRTLPPNFEDEDPTDAGDEKDIPPAVPTVIVRVGPTVKLGPMITMYADAGLHNGLYAGAGVGIKF